MTETEVFVLADGQLNSVVAQIRDEQWAMTLPPTFAMRNRDRLPTLREIVAYHAYDEAWVPDMIAGRTMDEVGTTRFDGDLLGDDPKAAFAALVDTACAAVSRLDDLERTVHCSFGDYSARAYLWQANYFRGIRAHDIARVIGIEYRLPDELVTGLWDELSPKAAEWRSIGVFPPEVPVAEDAPLHDRLLGLTGRDPAA